MSLWIVIKAAKRLIIEFDDSFILELPQPEWCLFAGIATSKTTPYHLFWDDIDKLKMTDFKTEILFDLVDS